MAQEQRFEVVYKEGFSLKNDSDCMIIRDKETGVNYLTWKSGYGGGITPLLDPKGKPVIN